MGKIRADLLASIGKDAEKRMKAFEQAQESQWELRIEDLKLEVSNETQAVFQRDVWEELSGVITRRLDLWYYNSSVVVRIPML